MPILPTQHLNRKSLITMLSPKVRHICSYVLNIFKKLFYLVDKLFRVCTFGLPILSQVIKILLLQPRVTSLVFVEGYKLEGNGVERWRWKLFVAPLNDFGEEDKSEPLKPFVEGLILRTMKGIIDREVHLKTSRLICAFMSGNMLNGNWYSK